MPPAVRGGAPPYFRSEVCPSPKTPCPLRGVSPVNGRGGRALYGCPDGAGLVLYMQVIPDTHILGRDMENLEDFFATGG